MSVSAIALIAANLIPLVGVAVGGWSIFDVMFTYWAENVIVGIWNVVKMLTADKKVRGPIGGMLFIVCFFTFHYGLFCVVHGVFVFVLFRGDFSNADPFDNAEPLHAWLLVSTAALFISHGVSYFQNYIGKREYKSPGDLMGAPYKRMILLHVALVLGGGACFILGAPVVPMLILIVLKIVFDLRAHRQEHARLQKQNAKQGIRTTA